MRALSENHPDMPTNESKSATIEWYDHVRQPDPVIRGPMIDDTDNGGGYDPRDEMLRQAMEESRRMFHQQKQRQEKIRQQQNNLIETSTDTIQAMSTKVSWWSRFSTNHEWDVIRDCLSILQHHDPTTQIPDEILQSTLTSIHQLPPEWQQHTLLQTFHHLVRQLLDLSRR